MGTHSKSKLVIVLFALFLSAMSYELAHADSATYKLMDVAGTTGAGLKQAYPLVYKDWTCQVNTTGSPTEVVLKLEGNITGSYYTEMATWTLSEDASYSAVTGQGMFGVVGMPAKQVRVNIVTITGGTSPRVSVVCTGVE